MSLSLPAPIVAYFKARNAFDVEAILEPFDENATVEDEKVEHKGVRAIHSWVEETTRKYHAKVEPRDVADNDSTTVVSVLVTGDFPGSPILLDHAFTLSGEKIKRLEIS